MSLEATPTSTGLPEGITKPLATIDSENQSGLIAIIAAFSLGLVLIATVTRIYARHELRLYRFDDLTYFLAAVIAIIQSSLVFQEVHEGLGKAEDRLQNSALSSIQKYGFATDILYLIVSFLSKFCVSCLFLRLTPGRAHMRMIWATIVASSLWVIIAVILDAVRCNPRHPWTDNVSTCSTFFARWIFIGTMDAVIEVALVGTAVYIVSNLQMALKSKIIVVGAFSWRIPNIAFTCARLAFLSQPLEPSSSHIWQTRVVCTTQLAIGYTITAAVIPYLKPFMMAYEPEDKTHASTYPSSHGTRLKMSNLASNRSTTANDTLATIDFEDDGTLRPNPSSEPALSPPDTANKKRSVKRVARLRPERTGNVPTKLSPSPSIKSDHGSDDSERLIIKKNTEWRVEYSNT